MGGFFGVVSKKQCLTDVYFGTDYHSHLGTHSGGLAAFDEKIGLQRKIRHLEKAPFRTQFTEVVDSMRGTSGIGCINDTNPQPLLIRSKHGVYALCFIGKIVNRDELINRYLTKTSGHFDVMTGGEVNDCELLASLIHQKEGIAEGIKFAQKCIEGTASILLLSGRGNIYASRDKLGRLPVQVGKREDGHAVSFESFPLQKLGFEIVKELGPGEIVKISSDKIKQMAPPEKRKKICSFL